MQLSLFFNFLQVKHAETCKFFYETIFNIKAKIKGTLFVSSELLDFSNDFFSVYMDWLLYKLLL